MASVWRAGFCTDHLKVASAQPPRLLRDTIRLKSFSALAVERRVVGRTAVATRRVLKGVLRGFLGTYTSRYSDYDGYWLFGFLVNDLSKTTINLLDSGLDIPRSPLGAARRLAVAKFREQLRKHNLPSERIASATLVLERVAAERSLVELCERSGFQVRFHASAKADTGRTFVSEQTVFVAPHDPTLERRSARH